MRKSPSEPYPTDEYEPTDADLWQKCLDVVNGELREFTAYGRTIHSPNDGRGYEHMPNPKGIAWAVKQYNGFGGGWKKREAHQTQLRILANGGAVAARAGELDDLGRRGLARVSGKAHGRVYWEVTAKGRRVALAGIVSELTMRMEALLQAFDPLKAKELGEWLDSNFRVSSPKTPKGGKALKERMQRLVWVLKFRYSSSKDPDPARLVQEIQRDWDEIKRDPSLLVKFTDEGGTVVPKDLELDGVLYVNEAGVSASELAKYAKRLAAVFASLRGWRRKALTGRLIVNLKPPSAFNGSVSGKYKSERDEMWVRTTPSILRRAAGYASFEYILVHELGHRYEHKQRLPQDFDKASWWTTRYSRDEGESFAELFALGHSAITGSWDGAIVERFERVMTVEES